MELSLKFLSNSWYMFFWRQGATGCSVSTLTCKMELIVQAVNGLTLLTILAISSVLEVWVGSEYAPE